MERPHTRLAAWSEAIRLVKQVYEITRAFPREETFGLVGQMRRAAVSVPSDIAEGAARSTQKEFARFLSIAKDSLSELETQLIISAELGYLSGKEEVFELVSCVSRLTGGLHKQVLGKAG